MKNPISKTLINQIDLSDDNNEIQITLKRYEKALKELVEIQNILNKHGFNLDLDIINRKDKPFSD